MVTEPVVTEVAGAPTVLIPTFVFDEKNPAGIVALRIVAGEGGAPRLSELWRAPASNDREAVTRFREHTGRLALVEVGGAPYAVLADPGPDGQPSGLVYVVRVSDGAIVGRGRMDGPGHKYLRPAVTGNRLFVPSCDTIANGPSHLEAWDLAL